MTSIERQRSVELQPGFSPRAELVEQEDPAPSPSRQPETQSPNALLDGPLIQRAPVPLNPGSGVSLRDGIVSFGK